MANTEVRIPVRSRNRNSMNCLFNNKRLIGGNYNQRRLNATQNDFEDLSDEIFPFKITSLHKPENSIYRIFLMTYFPAGWWSRLIVQLLADDVYSEITKNYFNLPDELLKDQDFINLLNARCAEWKCWQTGLNLIYLDQEIFKVKEILSSVFAKEDEFDYFQDVKFNLQQENHWIDIEIQKASILEIFLPNQSILVESTKTDQKYILEPNLVSVTKLLALTVDHIDILLEDWYPALGTRFVHTSDGKFLVSRIVPCLKCMNSNYNQDAMTTTAKSFDSLNHSELTKSNSINCDNGNSHCNLNRKNLSNRKIIQHQPLLSSKQSLDGIYERSVIFDSRKQQLSTDLNDLKELKDLNSLKSLDISSKSIASSLSSSSSINVIQNENNSSKTNNSFKIINTRSSMIVHCFMIEECILKASENRTVVCPVHKKLSLKQIAPDTIFCDLISDFVFNSDSIKRAKLLGRGAFGFVYLSEATFEINNKDKTKTTPTNAKNHQFKEKKIIQVAMKTLQPVEPGPGAKNSDNAMYKAALSKWERDPLQYSSKAYCTARQELNILLQLNHVNIVSLLGICLKPLALILELAPLGALDLILKDYRRAGMQLDFPVLQMTILQIARALEYLHQKSIVFRDLKSENVLCWEFPMAYSTKSQSTDYRVNVKLADYGISRSTLPTGTKGFGGTEGKYFFNNYIFIKKKNNKIIMIFFVSFHRFHSTGNTSIQW